MEHNKKKKNKSEIPDGCHSAVTVAVSCAPLLWSELRWSDLHRLSLEKSHLQYRSHLLKTHSQPNSLL